MKTNIRQTLALRYIELAAGQLCKVDYKEGLVYYSPTEYAHWMESNPELETRDPLDIVNDIVRIQGEQAAVKLRQERKARALKEYVAIVAEEMGVADANTIVVNQAKIDDIIQRAVFSMPVPLNPAYVTASYQDWGIPATR